MAPVRKSFTLRRKLNIIRGADSTELSLNKYAQSKGITDSMLRKWRKNRTKFEEIAKDTSRSVANVRRLPGAGNKPHPLLEERLLQWFRERRDENLLIKDKDLANVAKSIAYELGITNFSASHGFIQRFKKRNFSNRRPRFSIRSGLLIE